jgi:glycosyltransferase involved in cell wall biosynthesis
MLEQALGHVAHAENLRRLLPLFQSIDADIVQIGWETRGLPARVPVFNSNWTVRAGVRARRAVRQMQRRRPLDALFVHTQVPAVLLSDRMASIPTVVSVDATPLQYDQLGEQYGHRPGSRPLEWLKWRANRRCFARAAHIVTWSAWAKTSLVENYEVDPSTITVIPPGVVTSRWAPVAPRTRARGTVRILFVGGDLARKGGDLLLQAFRELRGEVSGRMDAGELELHLVTNTHVAAEPGVTVHRGLTPSAPRLTQLYRDADVFCLPTLADTHAIVLSEAGAASLPVVATAVAGIPEVVIDGTTGFLVPPNDLTALVRALAKLAEDRELRQQLGAAGRCLVERRFNAELNTNRLVDLLTGIAVDGRNG